MISRAEEHFGRIGGCGGTRMKRRRARASEAGKTMAVEDGEGSTAPGEQAATVEQAET